MKELYGTTQGTIPRFLSITQTAATGILPEYALRRLAAQGRLPGIYSGRKFLVNFDRLVEELNNVGGEPLPKL